MDHGGRQWKGSRCDEGGRRCARSTGDGEAGKGYLLVVKEIRKAGEGDIGLFMVPRETMPARSKQEGSEHKK